MKYIPILTRGDANDPITTTKVIEAAIRQPLQGADLVEVDKRLRVIRALKNIHHHCIALEDADYEVLAASIKTHRWALVSEDLSEILHGILDATDVMPDAATVRHRNGAEARPN